MSCELKHGFGAVFTLCDIRTGTAIPQFCLHLQGDSFAGRDCQVLIEDVLFCSLLKMPSCSPSSGVSQPALGSSWPHPELGGGSSDPSSSPGAREAPKPLDVASRELSALRSEGIFI